MDVEVLPVPQQDYQGLQDYGAKGLFVRAFVRFFFVVRPEGCSRFRFEGPVGFGFIELDWIWLAEVGFFSVIHQMASGIW